MLYCDCMGQQWYDTLENTPADPIMKIGLEFQNDTRPEKVNAGIGMILNPNTGKPFVAQVIQDIAKEIIFYDSGYLPSSGHAEYLELHAKHLVFGEELWGMVSNNSSGKRPDTVAWAQTLGGTKALRLIADLLCMSTSDENRKLLIDSGWPNYSKIFSRFQLHHYSHENADTRDYNHEIYIDMLKKMPQGSFVLMQVCGYNDDGTDRTHDQWDEIVELVQHNKLHPILDFAYNGLAGGWEEDNYPVEAFVKTGLTTVLCVSNSKNVAYSARLGSLYIVNLPRSNVSQAVQSTLANTIIRPDYSNPSAFPAQTFALILKDETLRKTYKKQITDVRTDILDYNRNAIADTLGPSYSWIKKKRGMFFKLCIDGFSEEQIATLKDKYAVFGPKSSRINVGGFDPKRVVEIAGIYKKVLS